MTHDWVAIGLAAATLPISIPAVVLGIKQYLWLGAQLRALREEERYS